MSFTDCERGEIFLKMEVHSVVFEAGESLSMFLSPVIADEVTENAEKEDVMEERSLEVRMAMNY